MTSSIPPTLKTIAERAGVTRALVSMALRNSPKVAAATRARIQKIAKELGYRVNPMVRALMQGVRNRRQASYRATLGFITNFPQADDWRRLHTYPEYFLAAARRGKELGYEIEHFWLGEYASDPRRIIGVMEARGIPGVLLPPLPQVHVSLPIDLSGFSAVTFGYSLKSPILPRVCNHHIQTIVEAITRLEARGYRRIGVALTVKDAAQVNFLWLAGLAVARWRLPHVRITEFVPEKWDPKRFAAWVRREKPEVVIGIQSRTWETLQGLGLKIPEKIGFLHLDCRPSDFYSGMHQNTSLLAVAAVEMLVSLVEGNIRVRDEDPRILMINSEFHEGQTIWPENKKGV